MNTGGTEPEEEEFIWARVVIAGALTLILSVMLILDSIRDDYSLSEGSLLIMLIAILTLVGLEVRDLINRSVR